MHPFTDSELLCMNRMVLPTHSFKSVVRNGKLKFRNNFHWLFVCCVCIKYFTKQCLVILITSAGFMAISASVNDNANM